MLKKCEICKKGALAGRVVIHKGLAKNKGGTGRKISRKTKRTFFANLQKTRILVNGHPKNVYLCCRCIKKGDFQKV